MFWLNKVPSTNYSINYKYRGNDDLKFPLAVFPWRVNLLPVTYLTLIDNQHDIVCALVINTAHYLWKLPLSTLNNKTHSLSHRPPNMESALTDRPIAIFMFY